MKQGDRRKKTKQQLLLEQARFRIDAFGGLNAAGLFMTGLLEGRACAAANAALFEWIAATDEQTYALIRAAVLQAQQAQQGSTEASTQQGGDNA